MVVKTSKKWNNLVLMKKPIKLQTKNCREKVL